MEKEFIPYEQALALKELGFDEECLRHYSLCGNYFDTWNHFNQHGIKYIGAPLYQQAFRWFREKYSLCSWRYQSNSELYHYSILKDDRYLSSGYNNQVTYEEAELDCLKKLIELCKKH